MVPSQTTAEPSSMPAGPSASESFGSTMYSIGRAFSNLKASFSTSSSDTSGNTSIGTPDRFLSWFRDLPSITKLVIAGLLGLTLLLVLSPILSRLAVVALVISGIALIVQAVRGKPLKSWGLVAGASLILIPVLGLTASAFYGGASNFTEQGSAAGSQYGVVDEESGRVTLPSGVTSTLPDGWVVSESNFDSEDTVTLIPSSYGVSSIGDVELSEDDDSQATIVFYRSLAPSCGEDAEDLVYEMDVSQNGIQGGYDQRIGGEGTMASDEDAQWLLQYLAFSSPWLYDESYYSSEYPS